MTSVLLGQKFRGMPYGLIDPCPWTDTKVAAPTLVNREGAINQISGGGAVYGKKIINLYGGQVNDP